MKDFLLQPNKDDTDAEIEKIKAEIEMEQKSKGTIGEFSSAWSPALSDVCTPIISL